MGGATYECLTGLGLIQAGEFPESVQPERSAQDADRHCGKRALPSVGSHPSHSRIICVSPSDGWRNCGRHQENFGVE